MRSLDEVIGYHIKAPGGRFGHLADFIVDNQSWALRYFVVDTRDFLPGKNVLLAVNWIRRVVWHDRTIVLLRPTSAKRLSRAPRSSTRAGPSTRKPRRCFTITMGVPGSLRKPSSLDRRVIIVYCRRLSRLSGRGRPVHLETVALEHVVVKLIYLFNRQLILVE